jgi:hypothetical protein
LRSNSILALLSRANLIAEFVDLHAVIDDQIDGDQGIDALGVGRRRASWRSAWRRDRRRQGTPVKSWRMTRAGLKGISSSLWPAGVPGGELAHVVLGDLEVVGVAQAAFQEHLDGIGKLIDVADASRSERRLRRKICTLPPAVARVARAPKRFLLVLVILLRPV